MAGNIDRIKLLYLIAKVSKNYEEFKRLARKYKVSNGTPTSYCLITREITLLSRKERKYFFGILETIGDVKKGKRRIKINTSINRIVYNLAKKGVALEDIKEVIKRLEYDIEKYIIFQSAGARRLAEIAEKYGIKGDWRLWTSSKPKNIEEVKKITILRKIRDYIREILERNEEQWGERFFEVLKDEGWYYWYYRELMLRLTAAHISIEGPIEVNNNRARYKVTLVESGIDDLSLADRIIAVINKVKPIEFTVTLEFDPKRKSVRIADSDFEERVEKWLKIAKLYSKARKL